MNFFNRLFDLKNSKKDLDFSKCEYRFSDSKKLKYYRFIDEANVPLCRMNKADEYLRQNKNKISNSDMLLYLENHDKIIYSTIKQEIKLKQLADHNRFLKERLEITAPSDLLMELVCVFYIREDEDPYKFSKDIHNQKIQQLMVDMEGNLHDFFYRAGLASLLPSPTGLIKNANGLLKNYQQQANLFKDRETKLSEALS